MTYSRTAAIVTIVAAMTVVALSTHRWLGRSSTCSPPASARRLVIIVIRAHPRDRRLHRHRGRRDRRARDRRRRAGVRRRVARMRAAAGVDRLPAAPADREGRRSSTGAGRAAGARPSSPGRASPIARGTASTSPRRRRRPPDAAGRLTNLSGERRVLWEAALDTFGDHPLLGSRRRHASSSSGTVRRGGRTRSATPTRSTSRRLPRPAFRARCSIIVALRSRCSWPCSSRPFRQSSPAAAGAAAGCAGAFVVFVDRGGRRLDVGIHRRGAAGLRRAACSRAACQSRDVAEADAAQARRDHRGWPLGVLALLIPALIASQQLDESEEAARAQRPPRR